jgi:hypothetical protein
VGVRTLLRYLTGDRQAVLDLAASRWTLAVGFLFVLSAALAREYDGKDLLHEPWHLLLPLGASLIASAVLFAVAWGRPRHYPAFLGLFWMTAPLAWLYAIPYERFLSPGQAMRANLLTLAVVAAWRVALMVRVLVVLLDYRVLAAFVLVMAFGDAVALAISLASWGPMFLPMMAGIRLSESERVLATTTSIVLHLSFCSSPLWVAGAVTLRVRSKPVWQGAGGKSVRPTWPLWGLAVLSVVGWAVVLPWTQAEQQLAWQVEQDFREGRVSDVLAVMSAHTPADFPPQWEPPPQRKDLFTTSETGPRLVQLYEEMAETPVAPWVRERYVRKLPHLSIWHFASESDLARMGRALEKIPEWPAQRADLEAEGTDNEPLLRMLRPDPQGTHAGKGQP